MTSLFATRHEPSRERAPLTGQDAEAPSAHPLTDREQPCDGLSPDGEGAAALLSHWMEDGAPCSAGRPLPDPLREQMERSLRADFTGIRVHEGPEADSVGAEAYAAGDDIYFAPGRYDPESQEGKRLLAHELAHVVQQRQGRVPVGASLGKGAPLNADPALEGEADLQGDAAARGEPARTGGWVQAGGRGRVIQRKKVRLSDGSTINLAKTSMTAAEVRGELANSALPKASVRPLRRLERALALREQRPSDIAAIKAAYIAGFDQRMAAYPNLAQPGGIAGKVNSYLQTLVSEGVPDFHLEDYSSSFFVGGQLAMKLGAIDRRLIPGGGPLGPISPGDRLRVRNLVADVLMAATLIPSREGRHRVTGARSQHFSRSAIEPLSPAQALEAVTGIARQINSSDTDVFNAPEFTSMGLSDGDSHTQRLLKLSLYSAKAPMRQATLNSQLYQDMLSSGQISQLLMTSTGAQEQHFVGSCGLSARTTDLTATSMSLAPLLIAGRRMIDAVRADIQGDPAAARAFTRKDSVEDTVNRRLDKAEEVLAGIEDELRDLMAEGEIPTERLEELRSRWSRTMQKIGFASSYTDPDHLQQPTSRAFHDHWHLSAAVGIATSLLSAPFRSHVKTTARNKEPNYNSYDRYTQQELRDAPDPVNSLLSYDSIGKAARENGVTTQGMWQDVYCRGGMVMGVNGRHGVFVKAVVRNGVQLFAVNDPKARAFKFLTLAEWPAYVREHCLHAPPNILS